MNLSTAFLDELRSRTSIVQVVGRKVTWDIKKSNQGKGDMWAPCPFHQEKTASFHVDDQKGFYYCFGCHAKGDSISFLMEVENFSFIEAVEILASEAGLQLPQVDKGSQQKNDKRAELIKVMELVVNIFKDQLTSVNATNARAYLQSRGTTQDSIDRFEIGYALDGYQSLFSLLKKKDISEELMVEAGLCLRPVDGRGLNDRFRDRIMFPIRDRRGNCIAFGGRAMNPKAKAKYLNSPETLLFDKGNTLYNHKLARQSFGSDTALIVVEGYMDVIAMDSHGFRATVSTLGTAITEKQLSLIWQISAEPIVALDGDTAGTKAAYRLMDLALPFLEAQKSLRFCLMPEGQDPDDFLKISGKSKMTELVEGSTPLINLLWKRETEGKVFDSPERRALLDKTLRAIINQIKDRELRKHYGSEFASLRSNLFYQSKGYQVRNPNKKYSYKDANIGTASSNTKKSMIVTSQDMEVRLREALLLAVIIRNPRFIGEFVKELELIDFRLEEHKKVLSTVLQSYYEENSKNIEEFLKDKLGMNNISRIFGLKHLMIAPAMLPNASDDTMRQTIIGEITKIHARQGVEREIKEAVEDLKGATDESLTWRVSRAAEANDSANKLQKGVSENELDNHKFLSDGLQALIDNQVWKKKKTK